MLALLAPAAAAAAITIPASGLYQIQFTGTPTISGSASTSTVWVSSSGSTAATPVELLMTVNSTFVNSMSSILTTDWGGYTSPQMLALNATAYAVNEEWAINGSWGYHFHCPLGMAFGSFLVRINASAALSTTPILPSNSTRIPYPGSLVAAQATVFQVGGSVTCPSSGSNGSSISIPLWGGGFYFNITKPGTYYLEAYLIIDLESSISTGATPSYNFVCLNLQGSPSRSPSYCPAFTGPRPGATLSQVQVL